MESDTVAGNETEEQAKEAQSEKNTYEQDAQANEKEPVAELQTESDLSGSSLSGEETEENPTEETQTNANAEEQQSEETSTETTEEEKASAVKSQKKEGKKEKEEPKVQETTAFADQDYYIVQKGESLLGISQKIYGKDYTEQLCELNELEDENKIYAGQKLLLLDK